MLHQHHHQENLLLYYKFHSDVNMMDMEHDQIINVCNRENQLATKYV
jgi:hypothetical protein